MSSLRNDALEKLRDAAGVTALREAYDDPDTTSKRLISAADRIEGNLLTVLADVQRIRQEVYLDQYCSQVEIQVATAFPMGPGSPRVEHKVWDRVSYQRFKRGDVRPRLMAHLVQKFPDLAFEPHIMGVTARLGGAAVGGFVQFTYLDADGKWLSATREF